MQLRRCGLTTRKKKTGALRVPDSFVERPAQRVFETEQRIAFMLLSLFRAPLLSLLRSLIIGAILDEFVKAAFF
jgi:hypothetical protein